MEIYCIVLFLCKIMRTPNCTGRFNSVLDIYLAIAIANKHFIRYKIVFILDYIHNGNSFYGYIFTLFYKRRTNYVLKCSI